LAGATGLEPAASCVTGRRSNLSEAIWANEGENYQAKGVLREGNSGWMTDSVLELGDRAAF